ncbi:hypothetical protein [Povalibacter sp.]|uniref:hypothetical protein n=1 Tax=Povalibacter sp. TaxID=1962978 RepID=UPI002F3F22E7
MTNLLNFLERMGSDANLRGAAGKNLALVLSDAGIDGAASRAILTADRSALESLLGASANVFCSLHTPGEQPADEPASPDDGDEEPQPGTGGRTISRKKKKKSGKKKSTKKQPAKKSPAKKKAPKRKTSKKKKSSKKKSSRKRK